MASRFRHSQGLKAQPHHTAIRHGSIFQSKNDTEIENRCQYKMILKSNGWGASSAQASPGVGNGLEQLFEEFGADQREARHSLKRAFRERPFPHIREVFRTARSCQGRALGARRSEPLTARTVLEHGVRGKGRGGLRGWEPSGGVRGGAPLVVQPNMGGNGDSSLHWRISRALAAPIFRAHSVSLIRWACRSRSARRSSGFKHWAGSGNDFSFSKGVW